MNKRWWVLLVLPLVLCFGCSDDAATTPDGAPPKDASVDKMTTDGVQPDTVEPPDTGTPDVGTPDVGTPDKGSGPPILGSGHTGYNKKNCGSCHTLPVTGHTQTKPAACGQCHGGNGACRPNGPNSGKKDHKATDNCVGCHSGGRHGFTVNSDCVGCHLTPTAGLVDCP